MPGLNGIGLTRRLRAEPRTATIPIILLTAGNEKTLLLEGLDAGADDFLLKPFGSQELMARLRSHRQLIEMRREASRRQSEERYRLIVESARDYAIFTFDARRLVTSWNAGAEVMTGFASADIIGQSLDVLYTPEDREQEVPAVEAQLAHETGHAYNERWHLRKDGSRFWGVGVVMPLLEGGSEPGSMKILRDATAFHQAESAHQAAEDRFALVVQSIQDYAIYMLDAEGLGLGLAISQAIVAAHGGRLTAASPGPDQRTTFQVRLSSMAKRAEVSCARDAADSAPPTQTLLSA